MEKGRTGFDFERLDVFVVSLDALGVIDQAAGDLPEGRAYMRDQLRRAANSIALNIAEGAGEFAPAEKARFYRIAKRSVTECAAQLLVAGRLYLLPTPRIEPSLHLLERLFGMLIKLIRRTSDRDVHSASRTEA